MNQSQFSVLLLISLPLACLTSWFVTKALISYLRSRNVIDDPNQRSMHSNPIPRAGGLGFVGVTFFIGLAVVFYFGGSVEVTILGVSILWASLGYWDDRKQLSPRRRLIIQFFLAIATVLIFGAISTIKYSNYGFLSISMPLALILTAIGLVWFVNLYNFMDGMDGLAVSQAIVGAITLAFWMFFAGELFVAYLCLLLSAACVGFLIWNWSPAKIFMGDVGSIFLGAFFATLFLLGVNEAGSSILSYVLLFWVFIFDSSATLLRRLKNGEKVWQAHNQHYYQRAAQLGIKHDKLVILHLVFMIFSSLMASISVQYPNWTVGLLFLNLAISVIWVAFIRDLENRKKSELIN